MTVTWMSDDRSEECKRQKLQITTTEQNMNRYRTEHELLQCFSKLVTEQTELSEQKTV